MLGHNDTTCITDATIGDPHTGNDLIHTYIRMCVSDIAYSSSFTQDGTSRGRPPSLFEPALSSHLYLDVFPELGACVAVFGASFVLPFFVVRRF